MKTALTYGFAMTLGGALTTLAMFFTGFHDTAAKMESGQWIGLCVGLLVVIICLAFAMREKRANVPPGASWGYGSAFGIGVLTVLVGALLGAVFNYVYFKFINPNMGDIVYQMQVAKMEAKNIPPARIAQGEEMMKKFLSPEIMACFGALNYFVIGLLVALIAAIFYRKPVTPAAALEANLPPTLS